LIFGYTLFHSNQLLYSRLFVVDSLAVASLFVAFTAPAMATRLAKVVLLRLAALMLPCADFLARIKTFVRLALRTLDAALTANRLAAASALLHVKSIPIGGFLLDFVVFVAERYFAAHTTDGMLATEQSVFFLSCMHTVAIERICHASVASTYKVHQAPRNLTALKRAVARHTGTTTASAKGLAASRALFVHCATGNFLATTTANYHHSFGLAFLRIFTGRRHSRAINLSFWARRFFFIWFVTVFLFSATKVDWITMSEEHEKDLNNRYRTLAEMIGAVPEPRSEMQKAFHTRMVRECYRVASLERLRESTLSIVLDHDDVNDDDD